LTPHEQTIEEYFRSNPPATIREAATKIEELTGIKRSERAIRNFLKSIGMSYRKTGRVPGKANREEQAEFKKKTWILS
jgi:transposase